MWFFDTFLLRVFEAFGLWWFHRWEKNQFWLARAFVWAWFTLSVGLGIISIDVQWQQKPSPVLLVALVYGLSLFGIAQLIVKSIVFDEKRALKAYHSQHPNPKKKRKRFRPCATIFIAIIAGIATTRFYFPSLHISVIPSLYYPFFLVLLSPLLLIPPMYLSACNYIDPNHIEDLIEIY